MQVTKYRMKQYLKEINIEAENWEIFKKLMKKKNVIKTKTMIFKVQTKNIQESVQNNLNAKRSSRGWVPSPFWFYELSLSLWFLWSILEVTLLAQPSQLQPGLLS